MPCLFLILYIVVPSLCVLIAAQVRPLFRERYLNVIAPAYYLTFSYALIALPNKLRRWKIAPLAVGVGFFALSGAYSLHNHYCTPLYRKSPDWRALTDCLEAETEHADVIVLNYPDPTFSYYYDGRSPSFIVPHGLLTQEVKLETSESLRLLSERYDRIWFYPQKDADWDDEGFVETWLSHRARLIEQRKIFDFRWLIYEPAPASAADVQRPLAFRLREPIWFRGYKCDTGKAQESGVISVQSGRRLDLSLFWKATARVETSYSVFIHLIDAQHHIWAQQDSVPQGGDFPTDEWMGGDVIADWYSILVPLDTPPGDYLLVARMHDSSNGQRLAVFDERRVSQRDRAIIAQVTVE